MRMVASKGAPLDPGFFGSEGRNVKQRETKKAVKSLKENNPAK